MKFLQEHTPGPVSDQVPLAHASHVHYELLLDILSGCEHNCAGCYVKRKNAQQDADLQRMRQFHDMLKANGVSCDELLLGPTDIFAAINFDVIFQDEHWRQLLQENYLTVNTTLMSDLSEIERRINVINGVAAKVTEYLVVLDFERYFSGDEGYKSQLLAALRLISRERVKFVVNYFGKEQFQRFGGLVAIAKRLKDEFNTLIRVNPSFFNARNSNIPGKQYKDFRDMLIEELDGTDEAEYAEALLVPMLHIHHNGPDNMLFVYKNDQLYFMPFVYEGFPLENEALLIPRVGEEYLFETVVDKHEQITHHSYELAKSRPCNTCDKLANCVNQGVLQYMGHHKFTQCILPKDLFYAP